MEEKNNNYDRRVFVGSSLQVLLWAGLGGRALAEEKGDELKPVPIPFYAQRSGNDCYQACLKMILRHFFPEQEYDWYKLDFITRHKPRYWTFEAQLLPALIERGLDVKLFATTPYQELNREIALKRYGVRGSQMIDFKALEWAVPKLNDKSFEKTKLSFDKVEAYFRQGFVVMLCIDQSQLWAGNKFSGHGVILTGLSQREATIHDPARGPGMKVERKRLVRAWNAKGTDNAVILVRKKE